LVTDQLIFLVTSAMMVFLGLGAMAYSRNLIKTIMSFQVLVFGVNLALFASSLEGQTSLVSNSLVLFSIIVGAAVEAVGLAIVVNVYRKYGTLNPTEMRRLRN
jgi:NADH:ubiquinone oxidoreductase subunit K